MKARNRYGVPRFLVSPDSRPIVAVNRVWIANVRDADLRDWPGDLGYDFEFVSRHLDGRPQTDASPIALRSSHAGKVFSNEQPLVSSS